MMASAREPVIEWHFDESIDADRGGAGIVQDVASRKGASGVKASVSGTTRKGGLLVDGLDGKAYRIHHDAETQKPVTLSYFPVPALNSLAGTISFWIKPEWDGKENIRRIFYSADSGSHRIIIFRLPDVPHITFYYGKLDGQGVTSLPVDISKWRKGEWHHLVMSWDKESMIVFVDGRRSLLPMKAVFPENFTKIMIGENWGDKSGETVIDELTVYNEKLTDSEAGKLYNSMSRQLMKQQSKAPSAVKLASATPVIDGKISDGEYAFSASGMRNIRYGAVFAGRQSRCFLSYDDENLYWAIVGPGDQIQAKCNIRDHIDSIEDSVEFWLKFEGEDDFYQFYVNGIGNIFDRKGANKSWNVSGEHCVSNVIDGIWTLECSLPWKNFPFEAKKGKRFRFDFCRSYMKDGMFTSFGKGTHAYGIVSEFTEAELVPDAPTINLGFYGELQKGAIDLKGVIYSKTTDSVEIAFQAGRGLYPLDFHRTIQLSPKKDVEFSVSNSNIPQNAVMDVLIESEKHGVLYYNSLSYKELQEIKFDALYTNIQEQNLVFRFQNLKLFGEKHRFSFAILDQQGNVRLEQSKQIPNDQSRTEIAFDVSFLPEGVYSIEYSILDSKENAVQKDTECYGKYPEDAWRSNDGTEDVVPPPWTPLKATDNSFECWGRRIMFGNGSFMTSINSQNMELLAAPVNLVINGQDVQFTSKLTHEAASFMEYELRSIGCHPELTLKVRAEFDGVIWCALTAGTGTVDSLKLRIPLTREIATGFDDCSSIMEKNDLTSIKEGRFFVNSALKPFWWCGSDKVGLMGGLTSQRGRFLSDKPKSMLVDVTQNMVTLELTFVDSRLDVTSSRTCSFYLQPTPVKPKNHALAMIRNDRNAWTFASGVSPFFAYGRDGFWNESQIRKIHSYKERDPSWNNFWYMAAKGASPYTPEWGWFCTLWHDCIPGFAIYMSDSAVKNKESRNRGVFTYGCMNCRSFLDFKFDLVKERLKRPEITNFYYDLAWPRPCNNSLHGCVWKDEFGYTFHEHDLIGLREYYLRVYRCMKKKNLDAMMAGHIISTRLPSDAFFDMLWLGEAYDSHIVKRGGYYDVLTPEVARIAYANRSNEMTIALIAQFGRALQLFAPDKYATFDPKSADNQRTFKHYYAYILLHNLNSSMTHGDSEYLQAQDKLGWGSGNVRFYGYWQKDSPLNVTPSGPRYLASAYAGNGNSLVIVLNDTDSPVELTLKLDFKHLGLKDGAHGIEIKTGEEFTFDGSKEKLSLAPRDAKMILFSAD